MKVLSALKRKDSVQPYDQTESVHSKHTSVSIRAAWGGESRKANIRLAVVRVVTRVFSVVNAVLVTNAILKHMKTLGGKPSDWFVGIRLMGRLHPYDEQHLDAPTRGWIWIEAEATSDAEFVVRYFVREVGTDGPSISAPSSHKQVFAYRKGIL